jgi:hypothetical protein
MNTLQIDQILKTNNQTKQHFQGTFAADLLPKERIRKFPAFFIVNLCDSDVTNDLRCHWIAIAISKSFVEYYCTSGLPSFISNPLVYKFMLNQKKVIVFNKKQIQSPHSIYCGLFCCVYIYEKSQKLKMSKILTSYKKNLERNDEIVLKQFLKYFN